MSGEALLKLLMDTSKVRKTGRKIYVTEYLDYLDRMIPTISTRIHQERLKIFRNMIQRASWKAIETKHVHTIPLNNSRREMIGAVRCLPNGEVEIGKKEVGL